MGISRLRDRRFNGSRRGSPWGLPRQPVRAGDHQRQRDPDRHRWGAWRPSGSEGPEPVGPSSTSGQPGNGRGRPPPQGAAARCQW